MYTNDNSLILTPETNKYDVIEIKSTSHGEMTVEKTYGSQIPDKYNPILNIYSSTSKATKRDTSFRMTNKRTEPCFFAFFN